MDENREESPVGDSSVDPLQDDSEFNIQTEPATKLLSLEDPIPDSQFNLQTEPNTEMDSLQFNGHVPEMNGHGEVENGKIRGDNADSGEEGDADDTRDELSPQLGRRRSRRRRNLENGHAEANSVNGEVVQNGEVDKSNDTKVEAKSLLENDDKDDDNGTQASQIEAPVERKVTINEDSVFDDDTKNGDSSKMGDKSSRRISAATSSEDEAESKKTRNASRTRAGSQGKRASFSKKGKAETIATSTVSEDRRNSYAKSRSTSSSDANPSRTRTGSQSTPRRYSRSDSQSSNSARRSSRSDSATPTDNRPQWSTCTKVDHTFIPSHSLSARRESTTSESDNEPRLTAAQMRAKWESRAATPSGKGSGYTRPTAFGGTTGASSIKSQFERGPASFKKRTESIDKSDKSDKSDGETRVSASSMRARFEQKAQESTSSTPIKRNFVINKTGAARSPARKFVAPASNKCDACAKTVYPMEKLEADGKVYHKMCMKCTTCGRSVGLGSYAALEGKIYCKPHLKQLFKLKGNYDEGFGRETHKTKWIDKNSTPASSSNPSAAEAAENPQPSTSTEDGQEEEQE